jgi:hypothetical protein
MDTPKRDRLWQVFNDLDDKRLLKAIVLLKESHGALSEALEELEKLKVMQKPEND